MYIKSVGKLDLILVQAVLVYLLLVLILFPHFRYQLNPDGVSYMSIALKYYEGDFSNAVNGYWGPLISWLMLPFLAAGADIMISANLVLVITGLLIVFASCRLIKRLGLGSVQQLFVSLTIVIFVVYCVFRSISPDLLVMLFSLLFLMQVLSGSLSRRRFAGIVTGLTGTGLYLSKSFGFPFFAAIFTISSLVLYFKSELPEDKIKVRTNYLSGMAVFLLASMVWIALISSKYGHPVIGTAGIYNRALSAPGAQGHPMLLSGLIDPPNNTATSIWEDVSRLSIKSWHIFDSWDTILLEMKVFARTSIDLARYLTDISVVSVPLILLLAIYLFGKRKKAVEEDLLYGLIVLIVMYGGYALIAVDPRYIWLSGILLPAAGAKLIIDLQWKYGKQKTVVNLVTGILAATFLIMPVRSIAGEMDKADSLKRCSDSLRPLEIKGRIASSGMWEWTMYLSFLNGWQYYGQTGELDEALSRKELEEKGIDYFFLWEGEGNDLKLLSERPEVSEGVVEDLRIYRLK